MYTRTCSLDGCEVEFQTDNKIKKHCCPAHSALNRVRRMRGKRRKGGGGGNGGGGGAAGPTLFDEITPQDDRAFTVLPVIGPSPKPPTSVLSSKAKKAVA